MENEKGFMLQGMERTTSIMSNNRSIIQSINHRFLITMKSVAVVCCVLVLHALLLLHVEGLEAVGKYDGMKGKCGNIVGTNVDTPERCVAGPLGNGKFME